MIKEFFVKLAGSLTGRPRKNWEKTAEERFVEEAARERIYSKEDEERRKMNMREDRVIPRIDMSRPTEQENHDQPAA